MTDLAVVTHFGGPPTLEKNPQSPYPPAPGADEVLIRHVAVASNPKDWKMSHWKIFEGIEGNDVAGHVEAVGSDVRGFKAGDKVAAFTYMARHNKYGAYQSHSLCPAHTVFPLGPKTSFEDAATLPLAAMTAAIGLFRRLGLPEPSADGVPSADAKGKGVLIWGASSSVGAFAVQLAKIAGLYVVGVAGGSAALAKELGSDAVVDYRGKDSAVADLKAAMAAAEGVAFRHAYDAISAKSGGSTTTLQLAEALQPEGGRLTTVLPTKEETEPEAAGMPKNVAIDRTMVGTAHDKAKDGEFAEKWFRIMGDWLENGKFKANAVKLVPGGLAGVLEGLKLLQEDMVSGVKLVYHPDETPKGK
ncbi:chaperonin 10-like protein [Hyaloraphidium curvatum]|nr:chaperonin 10-like protein [Hyaloraphidium curvatum]